MDGTLECGEENPGDRMREAKVAKHQDCNAVRNSAATALGVVHGKSQRVAGPTADIAQKKLVQAHVDCTMAFAAAVLKWEDGVCTFSMGQAHLSKVFIADLKLGAHELDEAHFVNKKDIGFLENLNICDSLPGMRREARLQRDVLESGVNSVEGREAGSRLAVGKGKARGLPCLALVLALPGSLILVRCDHGGCVPQT